MSPEARANAQALGRRPARELARGDRSNRGPRRRSTRFLTDMNGAVAAAGGDMAKAALNAGLVDKVADRRVFEAELARLGGADDALGRGSSVSASAPICATPRTAAGAHDRRRHHRRHDHRRRGRAGHRRRRHHRRRDRRSDQPRRQGAGRARRQPRRIGHRVGAHPSGAAGRQVEEHADRRVDGQCRGLGRLLGRDAGRLYLRRTLDHHRIDRRVRGAAELPGHVAEAWRRRRRREDDRLCPASPICSAEFRPRRAS